MNKINNTKDPEPEPETVVTESMPKPLFWAGAYKEFRDKFGIQSRAWVPGRAVAGDAYKQARQI